MPASAARRDLGPFRCIEFEGDPGQPVVVLFHGYGASAADLAPLAIETSLRRNVRWVFPDAPLTLPFGGLAWFPIDVDSIERAQRTGKPVDWSGAKPAGLDEAREAAAAFIKALDAPLERIVLGGFSQGSMLALDCAVRAEKNPLACLVLSGNLVAEEEWRARAPARAGLRFFQSHGLADPILGFQGAKRLERLLVDAGWKGRLEPFEGGHAVPPQTIDSLSRFLESL